MNISFETERDIKFLSAQRNENIEKQIKDFCSVIDYNSVLEVFVLFCFVLASLFFLEANWNIHLRWKTMSDRKKGPVNDDDDDD